MKLLYINNKNANQLLSYSKKSPLIVKYYSPTCGACIGMQDEWEKLCDDLENNYHGELVIASVDPTGRDALDKYDIHTEIDGYPTILYLVDGKKISEFNGSRTHENMLKWIGGHDLIKKKQQGGRKKTKKFKKHFMWDTKGKKYLAKTRKQHLKGVKQNHTHKKPKTLKNTSNKNCLVSKCCPHMSTTNGKYATAKNSHILNYKKNKYKFYTCCKMCGYQMKQLLNKNLEKFKKTYISRKKSNGDLVLKHRFTKKNVQIAKKI